MRILFIVNDPPYGTERCYNAVRLAHAMAKGNNITVFLMADAVAAVRKGQRPPEGFYNMELMLKRVLRGGGRVLLCGTCMDARGLADEDLVEAAVRSTMAELASEAAAADKVLVF